MSEESHKLFSVRFCVDNKQKFTKDQTRIFESIWCNENSSCTEEFLMSWDRLQEVSKNTCNLLISSSLLSYKKPTDFCDKLVYSLESFWKRVKKYNGSILWRVDRMTSEWESCTICLTPSLNEETLTGSFILKKSKIYLFNF